MDLARRGRPGRSRKRHRIQPSATNTSDADDRRRPRDDAVDGQGRARRGRSGRRRVDIGPSHAHPPSSATTTSAPTAAGEAGTVFTNQDGTARSRAPQRAGRARRRASLAGQASASCAAGRWRRARWQPDRWSRRRRWLLPPLDGMKIIPESVIERQVLRVVTGRRVQALPPPDPSRRTPSSTALCTFGEQATAVVADIGRQLDPDLALGGDLAWPGRRTPGPAAPARAAIGLPHLVDHLGRGRATMLLAPG